MILKTGLLLIFVIVISCNFSQILNAQDYNVGPSDVLEFIFWQRPDLNSRVTVDQNGAVILPIIGTIQVTNYTPKQIEELVLSQIRFYDSQITNITVNVVEYNNQSIFITGYIRNPGKYGFVSIPSLWDVIATAGGPNPDADLRNISIVRKLRTPTPKDSIIWIDFMEAMGKNELDNLPQLKPGDTIFIQGRSRNPNEYSLLNAFGDSFNSFSGLNSNRNMIRVMGEVSRQGIIPYTVNMNLMEAIIASGGPTRYAKLDKIKIIHDHQGKLTIEEVNLENIFKKGNLNHYYLEKGDTIYIPYKRPFRESFGFELIRAILFGAITTFIYLYFRDNL